MSLPDRIDPRPPRRIYRWDLDKTYLQTDFDTFRQLVRTAFQKAHEKVAVPGASALIRELAANGDSRLCIVSGSPKQMRAVLEEKLKLDGVEWDELVLKDNVRNLLRGRFRALRGQVGYKLPALLESRVNAPVEAEEVLFGDDAEADAFIYSLYADLDRRARGRARADPGAGGRRRLPGRRRARAQRRGSASPSRTRCGASSSTWTGSRRPRTSRRTARGVVPIFNYFQAALVLLADGHLTAPQVIKIAVEMVQTAGHNLITLSNSFQDLIRRGLPLQQAALALSQALEGPNGLIQAIRPVPDIIAAFTKRLAALGTPPAPPRAQAVDYVALISHALPRTHKDRKK